MKSRNLTGTIITAVLVVMVVVSNQVFSLDLAGKAIKLLSPVGIVFSVTGQRVTNFFSSIGHIGTLQKDNRDLTEKLGSALVEVARLSESKKENDSLRADLGFKQSSMLALIPADVAYFDPSLRGGITVKVYDTSSIKPGNVVLSQGYMIGRVASIDDHMVKVLLVTDSTSSIPTTVQSKNITGIARGKIGNGLTMEQVPQSDNAVIGDTIVTSGLGGDIPKGLILGKVEDVQKVSGSIFQSIVIRPSVVFSNIERVMIAR